MGCCALLGIKTLLPGKHCPGEDDPLGDSTVQLRDCTDLPGGVPAYLALSLAEHLTAWGGAVLSAWRVPSSGEEGELAWESSLSASERVLSTGEAWELPAWKSFTPL